jgi:hypothetical protein
MRLRPYLGVGRTCSSFIPLEIVPFETADVRVGIDQPMA